MPRYAVMLGRAATSAYQRRDAAFVSGIGRLKAVVEKSTATTAVISATLKRSPATKGAAASLASKSA